MSPDEREKRDEDIFVVVSHKINHPSMYCVQPDEYVDVFALTARMFNLSRSSIYRIYKHQCEMRLMLSYLDGD